VQKENYQKQLERVLAELEQTGQTPRLLLHSCCAPCSSYVLEYLSRYFHITLFYYNPNIYPEEEYRKRVEEQKRLIAQLPTVHPVTFLEGDFCPGDFYQAVKGLEQIPEGGERCFACYRLRLEATAKLAAELQMDYFTTTLSISPLKNAEKLHQIGAELAQQYGVRQLPSDFKKKEGYKRSIQLSAQYELYRQNYCGCVFSQRESQAREAKTGGER
jgi:hypothetical protein